MKRSLFVAATPRELSAWPDFSNAQPLSGTPWPIFQGKEADGLVSGAGPALAGAALSWMLGTRVYAHVVGIGVAGVYPACGIGPTDIVVVESESFCDLGAESPEGWLDFPQLNIPGMPSENLFPLHPWPVQTPPSPARLAHAPATTCSTCTGSWETAAQRKTRTNAHLESMEGAAWALVAQRFAVPFSQIRGISNIAGLRDRTSWRLDEALTNLRIALST